MVVLFWLFFSVMVGVYANSKGRSGIGFFFIALIISPLVGFIIALVISPLEQNVEAKALESGTLKKCSSCAELVKIEAKLCKHCHTELT